MVAYNPLVELEELNLTRVMAYPINLSSYTCILAPEQGSSN